MRTDALLAILSAETLLSEADLRILMRSAPYRYKVYAIPKRSGKGERIIAQPSIELKRVQRVLASVLLARHPIHPCATAYRKGRSVRDNARVHARQRFLLKLDFRDFFPSIKGADLDEYLVREVPELDAAGRDLVCRTLLWRPQRGGPLQLSIGAPSSPLVSNLILCRFDNRVCDEARRLGIEYTRYADDLTFSTSKLDTLQQIEKLVGEVCRTMRSPKLWLNPMKTVHASRKGRRIVTGLVLANTGEVSLGRDRKRLIRAMFHRYTRGRLEIAETKRLRGWVAYAKSVDRRFVKTLGRRYGVSVVLKLLSSDPGTP